MKSSKSPVTWIIYNLRSTFESLGPLESENSHSGALGTAWFSHTERVTEESFVFLLTQPITEVTHTLCRRSGSAGIQTLALIWVPHKIPETQDSCLATRYLQKEGYFLFYKMKSPGLCKVGRLNSVRDLGHLIAS